MLRGLKVVFAVGFIAAGVWLYAMKEMGTVPLGTLFPYLGLWVVVGVLGFALLRGGQVRPVDAKVGPNPFERMTPDERERAVETVLNFFNAAEENTVVLQDLLQKYAPHHSQEEATRLLMASINTSLAEGYRDTQGLHSGPSVVLARRKRSPGFDVTRDGTSWFGGLPALGDQPWPRGSDGQLMTPLAQIDLTGLAAQLQVPGLPNEGSLAFFASLPEAGKGTFGGSVRYVPGPARHSTQPDGPLRRVENNTFGGPLRRGEPGEGQVLFPRMAMELVPVTAGAELRTEVDRVLGPARKGSLYFGDAGDAAPGPGQPYNRDSVMRFLHGARVALDSGRDGLLNRRDYFMKEASSVAEKLATAVDGQAGLQTRQDRLKALIAEVDQQLARLEPAIPQLAAGLTELEAWAADGDRWHPLTNDERTFLSQSLTDWTHRDKPGWLALEHTYSINRSMGDCVTETLLVMAVAEDAVFSTLPDALREAINGPYRQPRQGVHHKMFGNPDSIQEAAWTNQGSYLLLQLQCDDLAGFHWGDMGVMQFWITPRALKAGHWEEAYLTFEGN